MRAAGNPGRVQGGHLIVSRLLHILARLGGSPWLDPPRIRCSVALGLNRRLRLLSKVGAAPLPIRCLPARPTASLADSGCKKLYKKISQKEFSAPIWLPAPSLRADIRKEKEKGGGTGETLVNGQ